MKIKYLYSVFSGCALMLVAGLASATPVKWELVNVTLSHYDFETTQLSGSFIYDADLALGQRYSDVNITGSQLGSYSSGQSAEDAYSSPSNGEGWFFVGWSPVVEVPIFTGNYLFLSYATDLTSAGGVVGLIPGGTNGEFSGPGEVVCDVVEGCDGISTQQYTVVNDGPPDFGTSGYLVGSVVPIPATVWLFGSALAGLGWLKRKQAT
jgi:hypothetical protein